MYPSNEKEQFSYAYIHAVASMASMSVTKPTVDDHKIDLQIQLTSNDYAYRDPILDVQVKCTARLNNNSRISYQFDAESYNCLATPRDRLQVPRIIVIVLVPEDNNKWVEQDTDKLLMRYCGYWVSIMGKPLVNEKGSKSVVFPREQIFSVENLKNIMTKVGNKQDGTL